MENKVMVELKDFIFENANGLEIKINVLVDDTEKISITTCEGHLRVGLLVRQITKENRPVWEFDIAEKYDILKLQPFLYGGVLIIRIPLKEEYNFKIFDNIIKDVPPLQV